MFSFWRTSIVNSPSWRAPIVGTNPTLASGGMAFLAERMAAMVLETAIPDLAAAGIADALISDGKVVAPATDAVVSAAQRFRRRRRMVKNQNKTSHASRGTARYRQKNSSVGGQTQTCFLLFWSLAFLTRLAWGLGGGCSLNGLYSSMHCVGMLN